MTLPVLAALALAGGGFAHGAEAAQAVPAAQRVAAPAVPVMRVIDPAKLAVAAAAPREAVPRVVPNQFPDQLEIPAGTPPPAPSATGPDDVIYVRPGPGTDLPAIDRRFEGPFQGPFIAPTDAVMAVGRNHVVSLVNVQIQFNTKAGALAGGPFELRDFFGIPSNFGDFDPLAIYDPYSDRFIVAVCADNGATRDSRLYVAFSQTGDPTQPWNEYFINAGLGQTNNWIDYPSNGIDRFAVYYTGNMFSWTGGFSNVTVFVYDKEDGYAGRPLTGLHLIDVRNASGGSPFRLRPAYVPEVALNDDFWFWQADGGFASAVTLLRLRGDRFDAPTITPYTIPTSRLYFGPGNARQPGTGGGVATLGGSAWNAYYRNGALFATHAISGTASIAAWVHKFDLTTDPPTRAATWQVEETGRDIYFPHVLPDVEDDDFALISAYSGTTQHVTGRYTNVSAATSTIRVGENMAVADLRNNSGRHGDYFAIGADPLDRNRVWGIAQFQDDSDFGGNAGIASARFEDDAVPVPPSPVPQTSVRLARAGSNVTVSWNASRCSAPDHHLVWFDLAQMKGYVTAAETCDVGSSGTWTGAPPAGSLGVLVVGDDNATAESSHGRDSAGRERPSRARQCGIQQKIWFTECTP